MNLNSQQIRADILDFLIEEEQTDVWVLTGDSSLPYQYKNGGFVPADFDFRTAASTIHPEDADAYTCLLDDILAGRKEKGGGVFRMDDGNGRYCPRRMRLMRHTDQWEETGYLLCTRQDVAPTAQNIQPNELIQRLAAIFSQLSYAFLTFDDNGQVCYASKFTVSMSKYKLHRNVYDINLFDLPIFNDEQTDSLRKHEPFTCTFSHQIDGEKGIAFNKQHLEHFFVGIITYLPLLDSQGRFVTNLLLIRDITQETEELNELTRYATHTHQINKSCGITLWRYNPYTRIFHNIDPYLMEYEPDMTAEQLLQFTHPDDKETVDKYLNRNDALCTQMQQFHCSCAWENGMDYHYYKFIQTPFFNENGTLIEYGITRIDETEKAQTDRMLHISQRVGKVGSWSVDFSTGKRMHTEEIERLLEIDRLNTTDFDLSDYIYKEDRSKLARIIAESKIHGTNFSYILRFQSPDGRIKWMEIRSIAVKNVENKVSGYYGTLTDVTDIHLARLKAEESDRLKTAFLANMSHEIRTPLNSIVGFSDILATEEVSPEEKQMFGQIIRSNNEQLLTLINDILDLSELESGSVRFTKTLFDVEELMNEIFVSYRPKFRELPILLLYTPQGKHITMYQDRQRLTGILTNFVNNAIKYTHEGSITLAYEQEGNGIKFMVTDTGVGISPESQAKVFDRFEKLNSMVKGTGLGLSICKTLAEYMHGRIGLESTPGKGSTFWVWIGLK